LKTELLLAMKLSPLTRLPKHKYFGYSPRFYDPIKEEVEERTRRLREELKGSSSEDYESSIAGSFRKKSRNTPQGFSYSSSLVQLFIAIVLFGTFVGYLFYGNLIFYVLLLGIPVYLYLKFRGIFSKKSPR